MYHQIIQLVPLRFIIPNPPLGGQIREQGTFSFYDCFDLFSAEGLICGMYE
jgi:hypothetical protein